MRGLSHVDGNEFEREGANVFRVIAADERLHGPAEIATIAHHARDGEDWGRARACGYLRSRLGTDGYFLLMEN